MLVMGRIHLSDFDSQYPPLNVSQLTLLSVYILTAHNLSADHEGGHQSRSNTMKKSMNRCVLR